MIHPSYVDLMNVVNNEVEEGEQPVINSRYSVVMATAKRARQIIAGDEPMVRVKDKQKPLSIAVDEMNQAQLRILTEEEKEALLAGSDEEEEVTDTAEENE
jgi:DNA-directed RNA polymerase subunit omega